MPKTYEPDSQFVERLEWQLASEFRRVGRLKPAAGKVAVPRRMAAAVLAAVVILTGVAVSKAADYIKDSWRKKIEVARAEMEVKLKTAHLQYAREMAAAAGTRVSAGLIHEEEYQALKLAADMAALGLERLLLNRDEVKVSGEAPRNELYAPVAGGRDFVSERLAVERKELGLILESVEKRMGRLGRLVETGMVQKSELDSVQEEIAVRKAMLDEIQARLDLRRRFVAGEVTAEEVEIKGRLAAAESRLTRAVEQVDSLKARLERLKSLEAAGLVHRTEVQEHQLALDAAQAELSLAALEKDVLEKVR